MPILLVTLKKLTGKKFTSPDDVKEWLAKNGTTIREKQKKLDEEEKAQKDAGKRASR